MIRLAAGIALFLAVSAPAETIAPDVDCAKLSGYCVVSMRFLEAQDKRFEEMARLLREAKAETPACVEKNRV